MLVKRYSRHPMRLFDELFNDLVKMNEEENEFKVPVHDIIENDKEYLVEMLLAGVKKEDISLDIEGDELVVTAERKEIKDLNYNRKQSYFGKYKRMFVLPEDVNIDNIDASLSDGILTIKIPKADSKKLTKSKIQIK